MWSVNLDVSISGEYQTLGVNSSQRSEELEALATSLGAQTTSLEPPKSGGDKPGSTGDIY